MGSWGKACSPKNFVGHPVADARKELLYEEEGFEWGTGAAGADILEFSLLLNIEEWMGGGRVVHQEGGCGERAKRTRPKRRGS